MRLVSLLALTLAAAAAAPTAMAGDRYGPPPVRRPVPVGAPATGAPPAAGAPTPISYAGPTLSWANKTPGVAPVSAAPSAPQIPQRLPGGLYRAPAAPAPPAAPVAPLAPAAPYPPPASYAPASLPDSLYAPVQPARTAPAAATPPTAPYAPVATLPPPPAPTKIAAASPYAASAPRAYSVIREYGGTPDPIAPPAYAGSPAYRPETSLTTPLDDPKPKSKDRTAQPSDPDWGAADDPGLSQGN